MTSDELLKLQNLISRTISGLEESSIYLEEATKPIAPSCAIGRLSRMEAIGEKSVNEAMHINVKLRLKKLKNAMNRIENGTYGIWLRCNASLASQVQGAVID